MKKQRLLWAIGLVIVVFAAGQQTDWLSRPPQVLQESNPGFYEVIRFSDGDTIVVDMNGKEETIRMIGVDTPETHHPDLPVQCYGPAAAAYTNNLIADQRVRLEADPTNQNRDRYDRLLRYVYLPDGRLVQAEIIKSGHGFAYTSFPFTKKDEFMRLEQEAKQNYKGLWARCTVTETNNRKQTSPAE